MADEAHIDAILADVKDELLRSLTSFPQPLASAHEGYAVLLEELDEAWDEIKANRPTQAAEEMVQVAAMAVRFLYEVQA